MIEADASSDREWWLLALPQAQTEPTAGVYRTIKFTRGLLRGLQLAETLRCEFKADTVAGRYGGE